MVDREHEEWLQDEIARKAAKNKFNPPIPPKKADDRKREEPTDDQDGRVWRGDAA